MYKSYKFRMYPNKNQLELLNKSFGCSRFIYNHYLNKRVYKCNNCHHIQDRDLNASINIMFEGLKLYMKELRI